MAYIPSLAVDFLSVIEVTLFYLSLIWSTGAVIYRNLQVLVVYLVGAERYGNVSIGLFFLFKWISGTISQVVQLKHELFSNKLLSMVFSMVFELAGFYNQLKSKENNRLLTIEWK